MKLKKYKGKLLAAALVSMAAVSSANAAIMVQQSGGVITAINGFVFNGQEYNITMSEAGHSTLPETFNQADAMNFTNQLASELNASGLTSDRDFTTTGYNGGANSYALLPSDSSNYYSNVKWDGASFTAEHYGNAGSNYDWNVGQNYITGMEVTAVPLPAAIYLFGAGIVGFFAANRRKKSVTEAAA